MDISIIILNYKSKGLTLNCIKSIKEADWSKSPNPLYQGGALRYEIIVVDNNSEDSIGEILNWQYPEIKFIQNKENVGMGAGNNAGIRKAEGDYIVIANPDIIVLKDTFQKLYEFMEENKNVGVVGPLQFNPDRTIQNSCYRWYNLFTPIYRRTPLGRFKFAQKDLDRFLMKDENLNTPPAPSPRGDLCQAVNNPPGPIKSPRPPLSRGRFQGGAREVDWILGSFLFCRAEALRQVGSFDENFFLYFEDTDLCRRFWQKNWKVVYNPEAQVIHNHARKSAEEPWYKFFTSPAARAHIASWIKYLRKWGFSCNP